MAETDERADIYKDAHSLSNPYHSKGYSNLNKPQHPTIAEELKAVFETHIEIGNGSVDKEIKDINLSVQSQLLSTMPENVNPSEIGGLSTIVEHQNNTSIEEEFDPNELAGENLSNTSNNNLTRRAVSLRQKPSNIILHSPLIEASESISSQETNESENVNIDFNKNGIKREEQGNTT